MNKFFILSLLVLISLSKSFEPKDQTAFFKEKLGADLPFYTETGFVGVDGPIGGNNQYFYHLFLKDGVTKLADVKEEDSFALWLNGGPGSSSQFGNYEELGPITITYDTKTKKQVFKLRVYYLSISKEYSWNKISHQLFVDQPFNVGLSYSNGTELVNNTDTAAQYFVKFLEGFFTNRKELAKTKFYIFGESYAGHYIPAIAAAFLRSDALKLANFVGIAIGDGWTLPFDQVAYYGSYLYAAGIVDDYRRDLFRAEVAKSQSAILAKDYVTATRKFDDVSGGDDYERVTGGMSPYNIQDYLGGDSQYGKFINDNLAQFGAPKGLKFSQGNGQMYEKFVADISQDRVEDLKQVLDAGLKVLLFNGQLDYIVNTPGALTWINHIKWQGIDEWKKQPKNIFEALNPATGQVETQGSYKFYANFFYATVYRAGHMVPTDNPTAAFAMIDSFVNDKWKN